MSRILVDTAVPARVNYRIVYERKTSSQRSTRPRFPLLSAMLYIETDETKEHLDIAIEVPENFRRLLRQP